MLVFFVNCCFLIDYVQWLKGLKEYKLKTEPAQNWREKSHFMWISYIKCWTVTPLIFNVNKKLWGPPAAALKKNDCRKLKKSQFLILCYNCDKKEQIYFNYSHLLKNNAHQIQIVKMLNTSSASEHLKNLKKPW